MSFPSYDSFQGQQPPEDDGVNATPGGQAQQGQLGQSMDVSAGQFQGAAQASGSGSSNDQPGDPKTTLWYVCLRK